jgi:AraC-like DNA-binding protein
VAHADRNGRPIVDDIFFFTTKLFDALVSYLNQIGELHAHANRGSETAIKGLMLAELSLLRGIVEGQDAGMYSETERVFRCQWLIRNNLDVAELGVESLATELRCSAAHLSKLFHEETGERITEYITRIRLGNAVEAMRHSGMSVKEIAVACGFNDPNYFTKVFRKATGRTPVQFRTDLRPIACSLDKDPKVVYHDHQEHNFGLRPQVMEKAQARLNPS